MLVEVILLFLVPLLDLKHVQDKELIKLLAHIVGWHGVRTEVIALAFYAVPGALAVVLQRRGVLVLVPGASGLLRLGFIASIGMLTTM
jgi:hypothetical protein